MADSPIKEAENIVKNLVHPLAHPAYKKNLTLGQRAADALTKHAGSWGFILFFALFLTVWMLINVHFLVQYEKQPFDPYPFILLNLVLSCLAAIQAPIILMSQNRQTQRDRLRAEYDYAVNKKAEKEIEKLQVDVTKIMKLLSKGK